MELFEVTDALIWHEFTLAFCYSKGIRMYIDTRRKWNRWTSWFIIAASTISAISYWKNTEVGAILATITAVALVLKQIMPIFHQSEFELNKLHDTAEFYARYQSEMERMYVALKYNNIHPVYIQEEFFKLKSQTAKYLTVTNEYYRGLSKKQEKRIQQEIEEYVREIYNQT